VALQQKLRDLGQAFQNFFDGRCGCPNFKSKHDKQAARFASNAFALHGKELSVRSWDCPRCEASHDRDINAADNIRTAGLAGASQKANDSGGHRKTQDAFRIERSRPTAHGPVNE
jgi:transposase